jgi:hypothetical protein
LAPSSRSEYEGRKQAADRRSRPLVQSARRNLSRQADRNGNGVAKKLSSSSNCHQAVTDGIGGDLIE